MKGLIPITALLLIAWLLGGAWWYSKTCCNQTAIANTAIATTTTTPTTTTAAVRQLLIADEPRFRTTANDNLLFTNGGFDFNKPLSPELAKSYTDLANYLKANPKRSLTITGLYGKDEKNTSLLPDMGLARAANLKQHLERLGINGKQILTNSQMLPNFKLENGQLIGGVQYAFGDIIDAPATKTDNDRLAQIEKDLKANPIVLYFETAQSNIVVDDATRKKFADLIYYLEQKTDKKAIVVGHTDDVGPANVNLRYGTERAEFAKNYMVKNGLNGDKITTASKGETQPVNSNKTAEGRAKNRRTEVSIQ